MKEIFLSYSRLDLSTVQTLAAALEEKGLSVWIDRSGIEEATPTTRKSRTRLRKPVSSSWCGRSIRADRIGCGPKQPMRSASTSS